MAPAPPRTFHTTNGFLRRTVSCHTNEGIPEIRHRDDLKQKRMVLPRQKERLRHPKLRDTRFRGILPAAESCRKRPQLYFAIREIRHSYDLKDLKTEMQGVTTSERTLEASEPPELTVKKNYVHVFEEYCQLRPQFYFAYDPPFHAIFLCHVALCVFY